MTALLVRKRPVEGGINQVEALGSWLLRLAHANGFRSIGALCSGERLGVKPKWAFDADISEATLTKAAGLLLVDAGSLERLTLRDSLVHLTGSSNGGRGVGRVKGRWLLATPHGVHGVRYSICCQCILSDVAPNLRVHWRLSISCWCRYHGCELLDACPCCGAALILSASRKEPVSKCESCHQNLASIRRANAPAVAECRQAKARLGPIASASWITTEPVQLAAENLPVPVAFPHLWWDGVRVLLELCSRPALAKMLLRATMSESAHEALHHVADHARIHFDRQSIRSRAGLLGVVAELTASWPHRFVEILGQANITRSHFATTELTAPSWLAQVRDEHLCRKRYALTPREAQGAIALLQRHSVAVSKRSVKTLLGITESKALDALRPTQQTLSLAQLGQVVRSLDRELRFTSTTREQQASALRDACCVAAASWHGISFERAAKLSLLSGESMAQAWNVHSPSSAEQAFIVERFAHWMQLYLSGVRPRFERLAGTQTSLFLTRFGAPYQGFGIAAIFARNLRESGIRDWGRGARLLVGASLPEMLGRPRPSD